jgi:hypothetical protein
MTEPKTYFKISYKDKTLAKEHGAKWDFELKKWFAPTNEIRKKLITNGFSEEEKAEQIEPMCKICGNDSCDNLVVCGKCRHFFCTEHILCGKECKCTTCVECNTRLKYASHVFFCEFYGNALLM